MTSATTPSPCVNVCRMDDATGWCEGCLRTLDEIAVWGGLPDDDKRVLWQQLRQRRIVWRKRAAENLTSR